jgi:adenosylmethionine-8-amino-7-oxononanoate aminotransferase
VAKEGTVKEEARHLIVDFMQMQEFMKDPFVVARGQGVYLWDVDGRRYFDGLSGVFTASLGHANPEVIAAMREQLAILEFGPPLHGTNPPAIELAKLLTSVAPPGFSTVKLLSGGSEAVEAGLKMARQYHLQTGHPRKFKVVSLYGSYHGATAGALSATGGADRKSVYEPLLAGHLHVHPPDCLECPFNHQYPGCGLTCAQMVERVIQAEDPETVAAVVMSPVYISGSGFVVPPRDYFQPIRALCDRYNVLLIFDEIITGFGRLGTMFGADYYGVVPDLLCCGKGMSGGYAPLSAVLIQDRVYQAFWGDPAEHREFHHGHTYGGNPVSSAAGVAALEFLLEHQVVDHVRELGGVLHERLAQLASRYPGVSGPMGAGLLQGVRFLGSGAHVAPGSVIGKLARERGLLVRAGARYVALAPPLVTTSEELLAMCSILEDSFAAAGL